MKVYFEVRGGGGGETDITAYVSPKRYSDGYCGYEYDLFGKRHEFTWVDPDDARVYDHSELPADMWYSIRHGQNEFTVDESKEETWQLSDLRYDKVDRKKVRQTMKGLKLIDECKNTGDVYDVWKKYMKDSYLPFEFVQKAFGIMQQCEIPMMNGELGFYGMQNTFLFLELMEKEGQKRENIPSK